MTTELASGDIRLTELIRAGDTIIWSQGTSEPVTLIDALIRERHRIGKVRVFLGSSYSDCIRPEHADAMEFIGIGAVGRTRQFLEAGVLGIIPCHLSDIPILISKGALKIDVVFLQVSQSSSREFSYGAISSYLPAAVAKARVVIAEMNDQAPWTYSSIRLDPTRIDYLVRTSRPLATLPVRRPSSNEVEIASHVAPFIPDGAVVQIGIGTLPDAIVSALKDHRELGIHSGIISDGVVSLIESGVVTNATKPIDRGVSVTGGLFGTERLYRFAHANRALRVEPVEYTHSLDVLRRFDAFVTVNAAIEVDLTGQVNGEIANGSYMGTVGGLTDFSRAAAMSPRGRSIIVLPSRTRDGTISRIVARLTDGVATAARADADLVVTEYGAAELRGKTIAERVRSMINIAHPDFRESLSRAAREQVAGMI